MGTCARLHPSRTLRVVRVAAPLLGLAIVVNLSLPSESAASFAVNKAYSIQAENRLPESATSTQAQPVSEGNSKQREFARKQQIASDSARLLQLATELKAEMDKSSKETLSLNIVRKADAINKLAHDLKEEMKQSAEQD